MASRRLRPGPRVDPWTIGAYFGQSSAKRTIVHSNIAVHFVEKIGEDIVGCSRGCRGCACRTLPGIALSLNHLEPTAQNGATTPRTWRPEFGDKRLPAYSLGSM
jgi:hypothetical protein